MTSLPASPRVGAAGEDTIRALHHRANPSRAFTAALERYRAEIFGYLVGVTRDRELAEEAFATFAEHAWKGFERFEWRSSLRTWLYVVARNALRATQRRRRRARRHEVAVSTSRWGRFPDQPRTTRPTERIRRQRRLEALREQLDPFDRELLILRVDRGMSWLDAARVLAPEEEPARAAARLRKRYERAKRRMRDVAERDGLLEV